MDDGGDFVVFGGQDHRNGHKAALREDHIRLIGPDDLQCFRIAFDHPERVGKVFQIKVAAQLPGGDPFIRDTGPFDQLLLDPLVGADLTDIISLFL